MRIPVPAQSLIAAALLAAGAAPLTAPAAPVAP